MSWMIPSVIVTMASTFLLALVYVYLYTLYRERYMGIWAFSWSVCSLRYVFDLCMLLGQESAALMIGNQVSSFVSGLILLWGIYAFLGKPMPRWWAYGAFLGLIWINTAILSNLSFFLITMPTFLFLGIIYFWTGLVLVRHRELTGAVKYATGLAFMLWGIHKVNYPLLRTLTWFAPWGYLIASVLTAIVATGFLLLYFLKTRENLSENKRVLQAANEELEVTIEELSAAEEELKQQFEEMQDKEAYLLESERRFRSMLENVRLMAVVLDKHGKITFCNDFLLEVTGWAREEIIGRNFFEIFLPPDKKNKIRQILSDAVSRGGIAAHETGDILTREGERRTVHWYNTVLLDTMGNADGAASIGEDITDRLKGEAALRESEEKYRAIFENTGTATVIVEEDSTISLANTGFEKLSGYSREEIEGKKSWTEFVAGDDLEIMKKYHRVRRTGQENAPRNYEFGFIDRYGSVKDIYLTIDLIPGTSESVSSLLDITGRKQAEEQLKYLSLHDPLTKLYNRTYFEEEMRRLEAGRSYPIGIIICDVDGLKLVNDTLGHGAGDTLLAAAANVIKSSFDESDVVARIGGDEFAVLLPKRSGLVMESACQRIQEGVLKYNSLNPGLPMSISAGFAVSSEEPANLSELFKEADNNMYREKLHSRQSARNAIVQTMMKALEARDYITEGHADRLQDLVEKLAVSIGLSDHKITDLRLLAQFHDIGKVGIPDRILFKPGHLTAEEFAEMQRHCEIGHRIAQSAPDLVPIADWILKHHEWWNGHGYPLGLNGEEIPLECRILAIADAYDAMTSDRPYRKAFSREEALQELKKQSGTQFDPHLVHIFVQVLENKGTA